MSDYDLEAHRASVLHTDLRLRTDYPHLRTEVYEIPPIAHVIYVPKEQLDLQPLGKKFSENYKRIGEDLRIVNQRPPQGTRLAGIADDEIGTGIAGLVLTQADIETVIAGRFPQLPPLTGITSERGAAMRFSFAAAVDPDLEVDLRAFLRPLVRGRPIAFDVRTETPAGSDNPVSEVVAASQATRFKPIHKRAGIPTFVREEEEWWFASLPALLRGELRSQLSTFVRDAGSACYLHAGATSQIDLRQTLLAYDTIYMEPPTPEGGRTSSGPTVSGTELLELVAADRVRFLHLGPEERSDPGFLEEARQANPRGVMGRRRSAAFLVSDIVETADEYVLGRPGFGDQVFELIKSVAAESGAPIDEMSRLLVGPIHARRACLQPLLERGLLCFDVVGKELGASLERLLRERLSSEVSYFGKQVHVAHALDATLVPAWPGDTDFIESWIPTMRVMGDRLNFYRSANDRIAAAWAVNERRKEVRIVLPPLPLFDIQDDVPISEILRLTSFDRRKGRALITRLSEMPEEDRQKEVVWLTDELARLTEGKAKLRRAVYVLDTTVSLGSPSLGIEPPPVMSMFAVLKRILAQKRRVPHAEALLDHLGHAFGSIIGRNEDLSFLSKVSRIGHLTHGS